MARNASIGKNFYNLRESQHGIALVTVMLLILSLTVIGVAAITVTGMEGRMAGFTRTGEASASTAESCLDTGMEIILQTLDVSSGGQLPLAFRTPRDGTGPVPGTNYATLNDELRGVDNNNADTPTLAPNLVMNLNNYQVNGDIDRLYVQPKPGTSQAFDEPQSGSAEIIYRVDCISSHAATGTSTRIVGVYACTLAGDGCQRAL